MDGPVIGISSELGVEVNPGVGVARGAIVESSTVTSGAHADTIRMKIKNRVGRKGSRKLSAIFHLLSTIIEFVSLTTGKLDTSE
jgi:hypothetical protein